jgi:hypothetical protein
MDVFSMELGVRLSFVKISEFRGVGLNLPTPPPPPFGTPLLGRMSEILTCMIKRIPVPKYGPVKLHGSVEAKLHTHSEPDRQIQKINFTPSLHRTEGLSDELLNANLTVKIKFPCPVMRRRYE